MRTVLVILNLLASGYAFGLLTVRGVCPKKTPPLAKKGDSCGIPDFVDASIFGDNKDTTGILSAIPTNRGLDLKIRLWGLPKADLVLTAWLIWVDFGVVDPPIFEVANHASPCAPFNAPYGTGFGKEPNELKYTSATTATLNVALNFNPTFAGEGPLTREAFCFQKDVPGIQATSLRQYPAADGTTFIPTSSSYLRMYDNQTGFELLEPNGDPKVARSPVKAKGVEIIAHVDRTTHGVSQGVGGVDHYFVIFFPFDQPIGQKSVHTTS